jgi:hypothetical protein
MVSAQKTDHPGGKTLTVTAVEHTASTVSAAALRLADSVHLIARMETSGDIWRTIRGHIEDIDRIINRPVPPRYCGNCPAPVEDRHAGAVRPCAVPLYAGRTDAEVSCPSCRSVHVIDDLIRTALDEVRGWLWTSGEVLAVMARIGEPIPPRTWRRWRSEGRIASRSQWGTEPRYHLEEVRALRASYAR